MRVGSTVHSLVVGVVLCIAGATESQAPPAILSGTFVTNEGTRTTQTPFQLDSDTFIFGAENGGWFKMASVDASGRQIETRHIAPSVVNSITRLTAKNWADANRGGAYSVNDIVKATGRIPCH